MNEEIEILVDFLNVTSASGGRSADNAVESSLRNQILRL
jgi:hypothetical protein